MWFIYAFLSSVFASFRKVNDKHLSYNVHHLHLAWMMRAAALPITGLLAIVTGHFLPEHSLSLAFWISIIISTCITAPLDTAVYLQSLKHGQLSKTAPLLSLYPAVMLVTGALFLGQIPSVAAIVAVLIIISGVYTLNTSRGNGNILRNIWSDRGTRFGLLGVGTISLHTTIGSVAILESSPLFYAFWAALASAIVQFTYAQIVAPGKYRHPHIKLIAKNGTIQGIAGMLYFSAVATGPIAYVTAIRSLSATLSAVLGAKVFNEGMGRRKIIALCLIVIGAAVLGLQA
ncbi:MAG: EamA family transporter [Candidatus Saccharimonadales bacterium]